MPTTTRRRLRTGTRVLLRVRTSRHPVLLASELIQLLVAVLLLVAAAWSTPGGPRHPYAHEPLAETSVAAPVGPAGEVATIAAGLAREGHSCARVRANDAAVQVWCHRDVDVEPTVFDDATEDVDLVVTPDGDVAWARIEFGRALPGGTAPSADDADPLARLQQLLDASFLAVWPDSRDDLAELLDEVQTAGLAPISREREGPGTVETTDEAGNWSMTQRTDHGPVELTLRTGALRDASWPYAADSYATTVSTAAAVLSAAGLDCFQELCRSSGGGDEIRFTTTWTPDRPDDDGQIAVAAFGVAGELRPDGSVVPRPSNAAGLPFLVPEVRPAVQASLDRCLATGEDVAGTPAGVLVRANADRGPVQPDGSVWVSCSVVVGAPLVEVPFD